MSRIEKNEATNEITITGRVTVAELFDWVFDNSEMNDLEDYVLVFASDKIFINVSSSETTNIS